MKLTTNQKLGKVVVSFLILILLIINIASAQEISDIQKPKLTFWQWVKSFFFGIKPLAVYSCCDIGCYQSTPCTAASCPAGYVYDTSQGYGNCIKSTTTPPPPPSTAKSCSEQNGFLTTNLCSTHDNSMTAYSSVSYANSQSGTLCCVGTTKPQCTDTDGGYDLNHRGIVNFNGVQYQDSCSGNLLNEYVCYGIVETNGEVTQDQSRRNTYTIVQKDCSKFINGVCRNGICDTECIPQWNCNQWSGCIEGQQARVCTDSKGCNSNAGKPIELQSCGSTTPICGNGICESGENCLQDCPIQTTCGNGVCEGNEQATCQQDCQQQCQPLSGELCSSTTNQRYQYSTSCQRDQLAAQGYSQCSSGCTQGQTKILMCEDNSQVVTANCANNAFVPTGNECVGKVSPLVYGGVALGLGALGYFGYRFLRKKKK